jgi:hypothetical protein
MNETSAVAAQERTWGMIVHLSALSGYVIPFGTILGPLIVWQLKKNEMPFVDDQGKEAVNFQISFLIYALVAGILSLLLIGIFLLAALGIAGIVLIILASVQANGGQRYRYPLTIRFIK